MCVLEEMETFNYSFLANAFPNDFYFFAGRQGDPVRPSAACQLRQVAAQWHLHQLQELVGHEGARDAGLALGHPQDTGTYAAREREGCGG